MARALELLAREIAPFGLVAQGMTGLAGGRARPQPVVRLFHVLVDKGDVPVEVILGDDRHPVAPAAGPGAPPPASDPLPEPGATGAPEGAPVPLRRIAWARSGDKGDDANIGVLARRPELLGVIREQVTAARVREVFAPWLEGEVRRYAVPGLDAINIVLTEVLGGRGGTSSLRLDPQGKSYAAILLDLPVAVPAPLLDLLGDEPPAASGPAPA